MNILHRYWAALFLLSPLLATADDCAPATWQVDNVRRDQPTPFAFIYPNKSESVANMGNVQPGQINCRSFCTSGSDVNYYTCKQLATMYRIDVNTFIKLNPELTPDCGNIQPNTYYCIRGFIEPLRAFDGLCGPPNQNATCLGTPLQCCNSETWTCGNTTDDCAAGTCYEGACSGDKVYSTDGTCGPRYGFRLCAGKWGDCCNINGACGTGPGFCDIGNCSFGNCDGSTNSTPPDTVPLYAVGNTTDGTCGGPNHYTCNAVYGNCCNKDGLCGSLLSDCGEGCQPQYGSCSSVVLPPTSSSTTSSSVRSTTAVTTSSASSSTSSTKPTSSNSPTTKPTSSTSTTKPASSTSTTKSTSSTVKSTTSTAKSTTSTVKSTSSTIKSTSTTKGSSTSTHASTTTSGLGSLPSCGQTCFNNMLAQYSSLGCSTPDAYCLCSNVNFGYGIRDCSNAACGTAVASTVIAYGSAYCSSASATHKPSVSPTGIAALPSCGQTCFNNMLGQFASLGCTSPDPACLCQNVNFGYGIRDCSNAACGTSVASTVIAYGSSYCASATAAPKFR